MRYEWKASRQFTVPVPFPRLAEIEIGFHYIEGNQDPYFFLNGMEYASAGQKSRGDFDCSGRHPRLLGKFAPLLRWHLCGLHTGPMHYEANAKFWHDMMHGRGQFKQQPRDNPEENFKSTVVFGAVDGDRDPEEIEIETLEMPHGGILTHPMPVEEWCRARFDKLMQQFRKDIESALPGLWDETEKKFRMGRWFWSTE